MKRTLYTYELEATSDRGDIQEGDRTSAPVGFTTEAAARREMARHRGKAWKVTGRIVETVVGREG